MGHLKSTAPKKAQPRGFQQFQKRKKEKSWFQSRSEIDFSRIMKAKRIHHWKNYIIRNSESIQEQRKCCHQECHASKQNGKYGRHVYVLSKCAHSSQLWKESSEIQIIGNISSRPFLFNFKCPEEEQVSLYLLKFPVSIGCGFSSPPSPH